jgi:hypothetical protein
LSAFCSARVLDPAARVVDRPAALSVARLAVCDQRRDPRARLGCRARAARFGRLP